MQYIITHSQRKGEPNPSHTNSGLVKLGCSAMLSFVCLITSYQNGTIYSGIGRRFREMYGAIKNALGPMKKSEVAYNILFGGEEAKKTRGKNSPTLLGDGTEIPANQYLDLEYFQGKGFDAWEILKNLPDGSIILTGRQFCRCLGIESRICSLYEVDVITQKIICLVEEGRRTGELTKIQT